jgi:phospholipid/cholesterol/gamma-HCH transport system substrate-binding protein
MFGLIGAGIFAVGAFTAYLGVQNSHPGSTYLTATFGRSGEGLDDQSAVKIRGINVGTVSSMRLDSNYRVRVRIRLNKGVKTPVTTTAVVQPLSVFGPKFIDLAPGSGERTGPYLADGATVTKTQDPQDLADVARPANRLLGAVDPQDVATILRSLGQGLSGRGQELSDTIGNAGRLLDLSSQNSTNLQQLIADGSVLAQASASHGDRLVDLAGNLNTLAGPIAGNPAQITALLDGATRTAQMLDTLLLATPGGVGRILDRVAPTIDTLYTNRDYMPVLIAAVAADLKEVSDIIRVPGPHNTLLTRTTSKVRVNEALCGTFLGLCGPPAPPLPLPRKGK